MLDKLPELQCHPNYAIDCSHEEAVRHLPQNANQNGQYLTISSISFLLQDKDPNIRFHPVTLARTLVRFGFELGKGKRSPYLKEKDEIIVLRQKYLRRIRANRESYGSTTKPEIYLDESYVNKNHSYDFIWYSEEDGPWVQKPTFKMERLIIINAISSTGWVNGAKLVFQAFLPTGDYHGQMNAELFQKWFREKLMPNIPVNSIIIMDNAPYHNTLSH